MTSKKKKNISVYCMSQFNACVNFRVAYKQDYEKYKMVNVVIIFVQSVLALLFSDYM